MILILIGDKPEWHLNHLSFSLISPHLRSLSLLIIVRSLNHSLAVNELQWHQSWLGIYQRWLLQVANLDQVLWTVSNVLKITIWLCHENNTFLWTHNLSTQLTVLYLPNKITCLPIIEIITAWYQSRWKMIIEIFFYTRSISFCSR